MKTNPPVNRSSSRAQAVARADDPSKRASLWTLAIAAAALVCAFVVAAASGAPAGADALSKAAQPYQSAQSYQGTIEMEVVAKRGEWEDSRSAEAQVAYDRAKDRVAMQLPGAVVTTDGGKLVVMVEGVAGHHIETPVPTPVTYDALVEAVPQLSSVVPLQFALLTSGSPAAAIAGSDSPQVTADAGTLNVGTSRVQIDEQGQAAAIVTRGQAGPGGQIALTTSYTPVKQAFGVELADATFRQDTAQSKGHPTFDAMVAAMRADQGPANNAQPMDTRQLLGKDAPNVELSMLGGKTFDLSKHPDKVVVFDFWATWCGPCREGLPQIQAVHDWAKKQNLPVYVLPINLRESEAEATPFWEQQGFTMDTLMDTSGEVGRDYQVRGIPTTVIVYGGKVMNVHVGLAPNLEAQLKKEIKAITDKIEEKPENASTPSPME